MNDDIPQDRGAIWVAPGTTFCPNTPANWARFYALCAKLDRGQQVAGPPSLAKIEAAENRLIKDWSRAHFHRKDTHNHPF